MYLAATAILLLSLTLFASGIFVYRNIQVSSRDAEYARRVGYAVRGVAQAAKGEPKTMLGRSLAGFLATAGIEVPVGTCLLMLASAMLASAVVGGLGFGWHLALPCSLVVPLIAFTAVKMVATKRAKSFTRQFADTLPVVAQSLRASLTVEGAFANAASATLEPAKSEFIRVSNDVRFGHFSIAEALDRMARRTANPDVEFLATAVAINKDGGGELAGVLESVAAKINIKIALRGKVESITSKGRLAAKIMDAFPFIALGLVVFGMPLIGKAFWASPLWPLAFIVPGILVVFGHFQVHRIYKMPID